MLPPSQGTTEPCSTELRFHLITHTWIDSTPFGVRACAHIHGVYPYFYVARQGILADLAADAFQRAVERICQSMWTSRAKHQSQFIHNIEIVDRTPFYGYHGASDVASHTLAPAPPENSFFKVVSQAPFLHAVAVLITFRALLALFFTLIYLSFFATHRISPSPTTTDAKSQPFYLLRRRSRS